jgi:hypothetical protein
MHFRLNPSLRGTSLQRLLVTLLVSWRRQYTVVRRILSLIMAKRWCLAAVEQVLKRLGEFVISYSHIYTH